LFVLRDGGQDAFDGDEPLVRAVVRAKHFRHSTDVDALGELVGAKSLGTVQRRSEERTRATFTALQERASTVRSARFCSVISWYFRCNGVTHRINRPCVPLPLKPRTTRPASPPAS